jgi:5'-3' exonuclease
MAYGVDYYESKNEADELCAMITKNGEAWGCFTDDMDMFIYDCPYIIRNLSLLNHTVFLYNKSIILKELEMSDKLFREIMILSGTDYNINSKTSLPPKKFLTEFLLTNACLLLPSVLPC